MQYFELTIQQANKVRKKKKLKKVKAIGKSIVEAGSIRDLLDELKDERFKIVDLSAAEIENE